MMRRFGLRDGQWERIKDLLPGREGTVGVTAADNRLFVEAVLYGGRVCTRNSGNGLPEWPFSRFLPYVFARAGLPPQILLTPSGR